MSLCLHLIPQTSFLRLNVNHPWPGSMCPCPGSQRNKGPVEKKIEPREGCGLLDLRESLLWKEVNGLIAS